MQHYAIAVPNILALGMHFTPKSHDWSICAPDHEINEDFVCIQFKQSVPQI